MNEDDSIPFEAAADEVAEARIVAWVLGEASGFEVAELERLCAERPELERFRRRMLELHGLLANAVELKPDVSWKLSFAKRRALNNVLGENEMLRGETVLPVAPKRRRIPWLMSGAIAASVTTAFVAIQLHRTGAFSRSEGNYGALGTGGDGSIAQAKPTIEELKAAIRVQEDRVEERRKALSSMVRQKGVIYRGEDSVFGQGEKDDEAAKLSAADGQTTLIPPTRSNIPAILDPVDPSVVMDEIELPSAPAAAAAPQATGGEGMGQALGMSAARDSRAARLRVSGEAAQTVSPELEKRSELGQLRKDEFGLLPQRAGSDFQSSLSNAETDGKPIAGVDPFLVEEKNQGISVRAEVAAETEPFSTFSLSVSDVSFRLARAALERGQRPDTGSIKVEQFYNAVDYGDPSAAAGEPVAGVVEQSAHPVIPGRNLVRIGLRTGATGRAASQPLRLTLLVDQSGSMLREDRREAMQQAVAELAKLLTAADRISVIGFSRTAHLLVENLPGDQASTLVARVMEGVTEGGTNLEEAMKLGLTIAQRQKLAAAQNRVVLFTDGAANLGDADPARLAAWVKALRGQGVAFDVAGIGAEGLNDRLLGEMARNGNGRYYVAAENFASQLAGAFRPSAEDAKVQVKFNPARVSHYKLIGFEENRLRTEDFRNDAIDAGELAAEEAAVALYQVELLPQGSGEIGEVSVRFREAGSGGTVERSWTIPYDAAAPVFDKASPSMQLAGLAMMAGEKLQGGPLADAVDFNKFTEPIVKVREYYKTNRKAADLLRVIELLKK